MFYCVDYENLVLIKSKKFQEWVIRGGYHATPFETFIKETKKQYFEKKNNNNGHVSLFAFD